MSRTRLLIGTRKGAFLAQSDSSRTRWKLAGPHFLGCVVNHFVLDPRNGRTILLAAKTGHLGPTVYRSTNAGKTWKEAKRPPAFAKTGDKKGKAVESVFWLAPGHVSEQGVWYAGSCPHGLFRSEDDGVSWNLVAGFEKALARWNRIEGRLGGTPDGAITHSIQVDPRNASHLYVGLSTGGLFESRDRGGHWSPLNEGIEADFLPEKDPEFGQDPHCVRLHPLRPDRLYQQNHCGLYRLDRPNTRWERIGRHLPKAIGDIGFPVVLHPRDPDTFWTFPMDGSTVWPRTSPQGKPAVYCSRNAGRSFLRQDRGLPRKQGWFTVKRQAMCVDAGDPVSVYFGTTSGEIWAGTEEGSHWRSLFAHLPHIYSLELG